MCVSSRNTENSVRLEESRAYLAMVVFSLISTTTGSLTQTVARLHPRPDYDLILDYGTACAIQGLQLQTPVLVAIPAPQHF